MNATMTHYTYLIVFPNIPLLYIGVRSYNGPPAQDDYRSSSRRVKSLIKEGNPYTIRVISTYETRAEAEDGEIALHALFDVAVNPLFINLARARSGGFTRAGVPSDQKGRTYEEIYGPTAGERKRKNLSNKMVGRVFSEKTKIKMSKSHAVVSGAANPRAISGTLELNGQTLLKYETKGQLVSWCLANGAPHRPVLKLKFGDEYRPNSSPRNAGFKNWFGLRVLRSQT